MDALGIPSYEKLWKVFLIFSVTYAPCSFRPCCSPELFTSLLSAIASINTAKTGQVTAPTSTIYCYCSHVTVTILCLCSRFYDNAQPIQPS